VSDEVDDEKEIDVLLNKCKQAGVTRMCVNFFYQQPTSSLLAAPKPGSRDLFPYAINGAHERGIAIYLCLPVMDLRYQDKPFADASPDMFTRSVRGEISEESIVSPAYA
jgi:hypothetical protein